jgi:hypothetical protein
MNTLNHNNANYYFRSGNIDLLARISNYWEQFFLKDGNIKITLLSVPSDNKKNMILCYVQFDPNIIDAESTLHRTSAKVYNVNDQLFMLLIADDYEIIEKVRMERAYINACVDLL